MKPLDFFLNHQFQFWAVQPGIDSHTIQAPLVFAMGYTEKGRTAKHTGWEVKENHRNYFDTRRLWRRLSYRKVAKRSFCVSVVVCSRRTDSIRLLFQRRKKKWHILCDQEEISEQKEAKRRLSLWVNFCLRSDVIGHGSAWDMQTNSEEWKEGN